MRGVPVWATLISLMERGRGRRVRPWSAWCPRRRSNRRWWAPSGLRRLHRPEPDLGATPRSACRRSAARDASFAYSSLTGWEEQGRLPGFLDLTRDCWRTRGYGDFWPYMMVAEGSVDICAEPELSLWDMAAVAVVVQEAGGRFTGLDGRPGPHSGNAAASNGLLHEEMLELLRPRD